MTERQFDPAMRLTSRSGMRAEINSNGSIHRLEHGSVVLNLFLGNEVEGGPANLFLRCLGTPQQWTPLLGPRSPTRFQLGADGSRLEGSGKWLDFEYSLALVLAQDATAWFWHLDVRNTGSVAQQIDVTYVQDIALSSYFGVRLNEFYVSQYIDHMPLEHDSRGTAIACRQNQSIDGHYPWSLIGSLHKAASFGTDALQFYGLSARTGEAPVGISADLPGRRLQHEHSMVALRDSALQVAAGGSASTGFFGLYVPDHPAATSEADLARVQEVLRLPEATSGAARPPASYSGGAVSTATLFSHAPALATKDLDTGALQALFGQWRHEETEGDSRLSLFCENQRHVTLRAKELRVLRPHGHVLRTGRHLSPDEAGLTSTTWMNGVFHSMVTQGHVSINRMLSTVHSYLGLFRSHGQRVFIRIGNAWQLLDVPSAFEMSPTACRWIYTHAHGTVEVCSQAKSDPHELSLAIEVTSGEPAAFLISHHVALNGDDGSVPGRAVWRREGASVVLAPAAGSDLAQRFPQGTFAIVPAAGTSFQQVGGDELLFLDGQSRLQPFVCLLTAPARSVGLRLRGGLVAETLPAPALAESVNELSPRLIVRAAPDGPASEPLARLADIVPWFAHNALVHYLSPRGLEQYSGGGWGTRDVCQGPVELLFALGRFEPIRDLLLRVLAAQNRDGDWPQWFMFFDRERNIRAGDSHGDIVFWPLVVLAQYLVATGDSGLLNERVPFFDPAGPGRGEQATVWEHVLRAIALIETRVIPGTALAAYGHGDWNDSLQPADPALRDNMCSAWTVTLHHQMLSGLARALHVIGRPEEAPRFETWAQTVQRDFQRLLVINGVLTGYAHFEPGDKIRYLLHPEDASTGVHYSSLAMIHAVLEDMLTPQQTQAHLDLIARHLTTPDGVRLFDRPMPYHGGLQKLFQRAETATFFGREIGLMYMHAHLRFAQALAHVGRATEFFHALCQANPIAIRAVVPSASLRQSNCYYSSSDAAFPDRYAASEEYERIARGTIALDGGWRVYSSGAGIALGLIVRRFLGLAWEFEGLHVDPVIPATLDGLRVETTLLGHAIEVHYRIASAGCGVNSIVLNDTPLAFVQRPNLHRGCAALIAKEQLLDRLTPARNRLTVSLD